MMLIKLWSIHGGVKVAAGFVLAVAIALSGTLQVKAAPLGTPGNSNRTSHQAKSRDQVIDQKTDHFFYSVNPELNRRKLTQRDRAYVREWQTIRAAVAPLVKPTVEVCADPSPSDPKWEFDAIAGKSYQDTYDYLADVIFYSRNPKLAGQRLRPGTAYAKEWSAIRKELFIDVCGL
jgi:hypothetical protein